MNALERLAQAGTNSVGTHTFIDADTIRDADGTSYRLQGYDAPEVAGFKGGKWKAGTAGAADATREITRLAESQGYTNIVKTGQVDPNGREIIELHDQNGRNFTTELLKSGALDAGKYTTQDDLDAIAVAKAFGNNNDEFSDAADKIAGAIEEETDRPIAFRQAALNEAAYAEGHGTAALSFRKTDRDIRNNSLNPLSDAWDQGWVGAKEGYYGFLELLGDSTGTEYLADIGEAGITRARAQQEEYGRILTDWKDVNGIQSGVSYIANNAAMSLPYMVTTAAASVAGAVAAPVIGTAGALAVGVGVPSMVYAGQTWNEMEGEKDASIALTAGLVQGSLDRLGLGAITGKVAPNNITAAAVQKIMKARGLGKEAAEQVLAQSTKQELADFLRASGEIATKQLVAKQTGKAFLKSAASEGLTEVMQEATAYTAATQGSDKEFNWEELNERLAAAAIAGSTLGGAFSVPGSAKGALDHRALLGDHALADETTATQSALWAEEEKKSNGYVATNAENLANIHKQITSEGVGLSLEEQAQDYKDHAKGRSVGEKAQDALSAIPSLWRGATRNIFTDDVMSQSRSARIAADLFGANPNRVFSGASFEDAKHHRVATYKNMISIPEQMYQSLNEGKAYTAADKKRISDTFYGIVSKAVDKNGNFNPDLVPAGPHKQTYVKLAQEFNRLADKMYADQKAHNPELGYIRNYLHKYKTLNKAAVHKDRNRFEKLLKVTDRIVTDANVGDVDEAFSVVKGGIVPSSHKKRSLGLSEKAEFQDFLEQDMFANVAHAAKSAARYTAHRDFIGKNGEVVSKLLDNMRKEGLDDLTVSKVAKQMQDYLDAESGNYKRPKTEFGKRAQAIQKNAMMFMTFSGLPLATFSSFVELGLTTRGTNASQLKTFADHGRNLSGGLIKAAMNVGDAARGVDRARDLDENSERLRELGFYEWDVGAATTTGVTETNAFQQKMFSSFFKANGLTQFTDYSRAIRSSFAGDMLSDTSQEIMNQRRSGTPYSRHIQEQERKLRNLGINIDRFLPIQEKVGAGLPLTPEEQAFFDEQVRDMTFNFINLHGLLWLR